MVFAVRLCTHDVPSSLQVYSFTCPLVLPLGSRGHIDFHVVGDLTLQLLGREGGGNIRQVKMWNDGALYCNAPFSLIFEKKKSTMSTVFKGKSELFSSTTKFSECVPVDRFYVSLICTACTTKTTQTHWCCVWTRTRFLRVTGAVVMYKNYVLHCSPSRHQGQSPPPTPTFFFFFLLLLLLPWKPPFRVGWLSTEMVVRRLKVSGCISPRICLYFLVPGGCTCWLSAHWIAYLYHTHIHTHCLLAVKCVCVSLSLCRSF